MKEEQKNCGVKNEIRRTTNEKEKIKRCGDHCGTDRAHCIDLCIQTDLGCVSFQFGALTRRNISE